LKDSPFNPEVVVVGGGTAGAVVAGRLAERGRRVLLLEAGPDYGPHDGGGWPADLLDSRALPQSHSWGYVSSARHGARGLPLDRARVIGGCSAHNGCAAIWGHRLDYDGWAALGNQGWSAADLLPHFRRASARLRVHTPTRAEIGPFHAAVLDAAPGAGLPPAADLNDLDHCVGMAASPINTVGAAATRWNAAFAYLDPLRGGASLSIRGDVLVDRLLVVGGRVVGLVTADGERVEAGEVVLAAGAYGSPAILLRSGIGPPDHLGALGVPLVHALPGVGANLQDHPAFVLEYGGTAELVAALEARRATAPLREEGTIGKARSSLCAEAFDLHLYPFGGPDGRGGWTFAIPVAAMTPASRGTVRLASRDPAAPPLIDHAYLSDREDRDLAVLLDGVDLARDLARQPPLAGLLGPEASPGPEMLDRAALRRHLRARGVHYYHPAGTCKMAPSADRQAVVDARGRVHGLAGLRVADAAVMPVIPRANTNLPAAVVGERIAELME
jgi:choline dehydrogenase